MLTAAPRNHALDNLRAIMMWLGIVLHVAVNHMAAPTMLPWRDRLTSTWVDLLVLLIHAFRMPVFFMLAGFFTAGLIARHGQVGMLKNRMRRIGLPLLVFWPLLAFGIGILALMYVNLMQRGVVGFDMSLMPQPRPGQARVGRLHLWFMFDLLWLYGASALAYSLRQYLPGNCRRVGRALAPKLLSRWWGVPALTLPLALIGLLYRNGILMLGTSFLPNLAELSHYGLFFGAGWAMYAHRATVLPHLERTCGRNGIAGLLAFVASVALLRVLNTAAMGGVHLNFLSAFLFNGVAWLWSFALIGAFSKYTSRQTPWLQYLADSSYWVYLVHMLGTVGFGVLLYDAPLGIVAKMLLNIAATTAACLLTYQLLVRRSALGVLLNGVRK